VSDRHAVIVVGGGPAGSVAALLLARAGLDVLVVERTPFPRDKPCGACLSTSAVGHLRALELLPDGCRALHQIELRAGRRSVRLPLDGQQVVSRAALDAHLLRAAAAAGARVRCGVPARLGALRPDGREVRVGDETLCADLVLAADGLAGGFLLPAPAARGSRLGLGAWVPAAQAPELPCADGVTMVCGREGYVGLVRDEGGRLDVAAAVDAQAVRLQGAAGVLDQLLLGAGLPALPATRVHVTPPLTRGAPALAARVLPLGDAGGYVEPFTGEGIGWALGAARAVAALARDGWSPGIEPRWRRLQRGLVGRRLCRASARVLRHPALAAAGIGLFARLPILARPLLAAVRRP